MNIYHVTYEKSTHKDLRKIRKFSISRTHYEKIIQEITMNINNLTYMPRIHKTIICIKDLKGEYRRIVSGRYSIIYKIINDEIIILRIFNHKENYLSQKSFILKEDTPKYLIKNKEKV